MSQPQRPVAQVVRPGLRAAKWTLGVLGIGALGIGGTLVGIDGLRRCNDFPTNVTIRWRPAGPASACWSAVA
jgi:hypothetical protein